MLIAKGSYAVTLRDAVVVSIQTANWPRDVRGYTWIH
jgi:hypothetical protein